MRLQGFLSITSLLVLTLPALTFFLPVTAPKNSNCMMVVTYSEMASMQFKKAFKSKDIEKAKKFVKKGMEQIQQAAAYSPQCNCVNAETYALSAYTIGKKGFDATAIEDLQAQSKKAMDLSLDAMGAAQQCNNK